VYGPDCKVKFPVAVSDTVLSSAGYIHGHIILDQTYHVNPVVVPFTWTQISNFDAL
jgi:hypothetical protein